MKTDKNKLPLGERNFTGKVDLVLLALQGNTGAKVSSLSFNLDPLHQVFFLRIHKGRVESQPILGKVTLIYN